MLAIEKMIAIDKADCAGCYACANKCPVQAIAMVEDEEGFRYPQVAREKCIDCGACTRVCPSLNFCEVSGKGEPAAYAVINPNEAVRKDSSSGGMFHLLAEQVLEQGGMVFGAAFDEKWEVHHVGITEEKDIARLRVSKYVQSRVEENYRKAEAALRAGQKVLFVGTPCQAAALKQYLGKEYENLLLVDFVCHGVPSPKIWRKYLALRAKNINEIDSISFRYKNLSWERYLLAIFFKKANKYLAADVAADIYMRGFLANLYLRPSCSVCKFCNRNRPTDITLADYWGVAQEEPDMFDDGGTTLCFIHSTKGQQVFDCLNARKKRTDFERAVKHNPAMVRTLTVHAKRQEFFTRFNSGEDLFTLVKQYTKQPLKQRIKGFLLRIPLLGSFLRLLKWVLKGGGKA